MKTWTPKAAEIERKWWVVDADGQILGRLAVAVALRLRGKHKPTYATHADTGDHVIVVNAAQVRVTGRKLEQKKYYRHSGYPGGLRTSTLAQELAKRPERVIEHAVRGMLPKNNLGRQILGKLKVYAGPAHPHTAQQPAIWELSTASVASVVSAARAASDARAASAAEATNSSGAAGITGQSEQ